MALGDNTLYKHLAFAPSVARGSFKFNVAAPTDQTLWSGSLKRFVSSLSLNGGTGLFTLTFKSGFSFPTGAGIFSLIPICETAAGYYDAKITEDWNATNRTIKFSCFTAAGAATVVSSSLAYITIHLDVTLSEGK